MAPNLPQIRVSDVDVLGEWGFEGVKALSDSIPGYRSSATFLTTLRSNLHLSTCPIDSPYNSLVSTPTSAAFSSTALLAHPTPTPLSISTTATTTQYSYHVPCEPERAAMPTNAVATPENVKHRAEALRLIGDSVAQQRQVAATALILHPYSVMITMLVTGTLARYSSLKVLFGISTISIVVLAAALYWLTKDYATFAAEIDWKWLEGSKKTCARENRVWTGNGVKKHSRCEDPIVLVSRLGEEVVGAVVLRVVKRERKGYVRAWTVDSSHRGKGVGVSLLQESVRIAWAKGARTMEFETEHANSHQALPATFKRSLEEQQARARALLTDLVAEHRREKSSR